jgi:hypothetical protein
MTIIENLNEAIQLLVPAAKYMVWENDYDKIVWNDSRKIPTKKQIEAVLTVIEEAENGKKKQQSIAELKASVHAYIQGYYPADTQMLFVVTYLKYLADLARGKVPSAFEDQAIKIELAWAWMEVVMIKFQELANKLTNGLQLDEEETDWPSQFDASKPA